MKKRILLIIAALLTAATASAAPMKGKIITPMWDDPCMFKC